MWTVQHLLLKLYIFVEKNLILPWEGLNLANIALLFLRHERAQLQDVVYNSSEVVIEIIQEVSLLRQIWKQLVTIDVIFDWIFWVKMLLNGS